MSNISNFKIEVDLIPRKMTYLQPEYEAFTVFSYRRIVLENALKYAFIILTTIAVYKVLLLMYRAYVRPLVLKKNFTDVGFAHILPGPDRLLHIARGQATRKKNTTDEISPPYPNGWFALAESRELKVGDVIPVNALGENFCVYRDEDGIARCVNAFCPHLGAHLGVGGTVFGKCIRCPFHFWEFDEEGVCINVPGENAPKGVTLRKWDVAEVDGAVWVWYDIEGRDPMWSVLEHSMMKSWGYRGRNEYYVACHIRDIPENGADTAHLNVVHSAPLFTSLSETSSILGYFLGRHVWSADWIPSDDHIASMFLTHDYRIMNCNMGHMDIRVLQIGPGHVRLLLETVLGPVYITQSVTPLEPLLQKVVHRVYTPCRIAILGVLILYSEGRMFERDVSIWNNKVSRRNPMYVRRDRTIRQFRTWFKQFYSVGSTRYAEAVEHTQWDW